MNLEEIQKQVLDSFEMDGRLLLTTNSEEEKFKAFRELLIRRVEELAEKDMDKLLWILYRVDVSEKKLRETLKANTSTNFGTVITDLIIERQIQKADSRKQFGGKENDWNFDI